ncbi:hypothetical protein REPUB_Repub10bG0143300 [Reevesia pubescens]
MLVDEIWHALGDETFDIDWYVKHTVLGRIYSTTEIYMLTDSSPEFCDTWLFLDDRVKDAFDMKKAILEVVIHNIRLPKQSIVGDVIDEFKTKDLISEQYR